MMQLLDKTISGDISAINELNKIFKRFREKSNMPDLKISTEMFKYYTERASEGNSYGENFLGELYYHGFGTDKDHKKALHYFEKSASQNNSHGQYNLGYMHYYGCAIRQDFKKAFDLFTISAYQNNCYAHYYLGIMYQNGDGMKPNYDEAARYFKLAIEQSHPWSVHRMLAIMYCRGEGLPKDLEDLYKWYLTRISLGDEAAADMLRDIIISQPKLWKIIIDNSISSHKKIDEMDSLIQHLKYAPNGEHYSEIEKEFYTLASGSCRKH